MSILISLLKKEELTIPECQSCGACCHASYRYYVQVTNDDRKKLADENLIEKCGVIDFMKMKDGHCIALKKDGNRFTCSVYENRPQVCRDFERGSIACKKCLI